MQKGNHGRHHWNRKEVVSKRSISWCQNRGLGVRLKKPTLDFSMGRHLPICRKFPNCSSSPGRMAFSPLLFPQFFTLSIPIWDSDTTFGHQGPFSGKQFFHRPGAGRGLFQDDSRSALYLTIELFYYDYISSTSYHQTFSPRGWGPCCMKQNKGFHTKK